jgi:hypothetical protein
MKYAILILTIAALLTSCGKKEEKTPVKTTKATVTIPTAVFSKDLKEGIPVLEARKNKAGDKVTVTGKIMGNLNPFVDGRAAFILGDPSKLTSCDLMEEDPCKDPWDVCCETTKDIAAATLNIQIVDANGMVFKTGLKGINGLKELSKIIVEGTVADGSTENTMTINATAIKVLK